MTGFWKGAIKWFKQFLGFTREPMETAWVPQGKIFMHDSRFFWHNHYKMEWNNFSVGD